MLRFGLLFVGLIFAVPGTAQELPKTTYAQTGPHEVAVFTYDWKDLKRERLVATKVYVPKGEGKCPLVIFSHGLGGSRNGSEYIGRHWASHGFITVHPQHVGSDEAVWKGQLQGMAALKKAAADPRNALARTEDITFVIDQVFRLAESKSDLAGRIDKDAVGMAGHSFGALTTLQVGGQKLIGPGGRETNRSDPRIKALVPMSAPVLQDKSRYEVAYGSITLPSLHMTGTLDDSPIGETKADQRRIPFDHSIQSERYLLILEGGDHMIFAGRSGPGRGRERDPEYLALIRGSSTAFWKAYLQGDTQAKMYLQKKFVSEMGKNGTWEHKPAR